MFSFTPQSLVNFGDSPWYPLNINLVGTHCRTVGYENINFLLFSAIEPRFLESQPVGQSLYWLCCLGFQQKEKKTTYAAAFWIVIFTCYYSCASYWIYAKHKTSEKCMLNFKRKALVDLIGRFWRVCEFNIRSRSNMTWKCTRDLSTPNEIYGFINGEFRKQQNRYWPSNNCCSSTFYLITERINIKPESFLAKEIIPINKAVTN